jgi:outer membrane protein assembly factor BamB
MILLSREWLGMVLVLASSAPLIAQSLSAPTYQESITLDLDNAVAKRLATVPDFAEQNQWGSVATLLKQTIEENNEKLVSMAPGWYVGVSRFCQCQAAVLPPAGLAVYRRQVDHLAQEWLADADRLAMTDPDSSRAQLRKVLQQAFGSSHSAAALRRLAEQSFEQADYSAARTYWEMLLPPSSPLKAAAGLGLLRQPDVPADAAQIRAQLVLCSLYSGNLQRAEQELAALRRTDRQSIGRLADREGLLGELLTEEFTRYQTDQSESPSIVTRIDRPIWSVTIPSPTNMGSPYLRPVASSGPVNRFLPTATANALYISNGEAVFAFDLRTGKARWPVAEAASEESQTAMIHRLADPIPPKRPINNVSLQVLTLHGDRLYARLGSPFTGKARQEAHVHSELVALDVGRGEGKLVWRVVAEEIDRDDPLSLTAPWCFEAAPAVASGRVVAVIRRSLPQEQINVACFDADRSQLLWNQRIGITVAATDEAVNSASHLQPVIAEDSVFVSTDAGAIAALDLHSGKLRWVRTYPTADRFHSSVATRRAGHTPPVYHDGVLYVAPLDSDLLLAIHAESGLLLWQREWPDPIQHVLGVSGETLVVQGRSLWGVAARTGDFAWSERQVGFSDPEGYSFGRGVLTGEIIWWPNRDELWEVSATTGRVMRRLEFKASLSESGGHLLQVDDRLIVSRDSQVSAFGPTE